MQQSSQHIHYWCHNKAITSYLPSFVIWPIVGIVSTDVRVYATQSQLVVWIRCDGLDDQLGVGVRRFWAAARTGHSIVTTGRRKLLFHCHWRSYHLLGCLLDGTLACMSRCICGRREVGRRVVAYAASRTWRARIGSTINTTVIRWRVGWKGKSLSKPNNAYGGAKSAAHSQSCRTKDTGPVHRMVCLFNPRVMLALHHFRDMCVNDGRGHTWNQNKWEFNTYYSDNKSSTIEYQIWTVRAQPKQQTRQHTSQNSTIFMQMCWFFSTRSTWDTGT